MRSLTVYKHEWNGVVLHVFLEEKYLGSDIHVSCSKVSVGHGLSFLEYEMSLEHFFFFLRTQAESSDRKKELNRSTFQILVFHHIVVQAFALL